VPIRRTEPALRQIGARIRKARESKGYTQEELAHVAALDRSFVGGLERGEHNMSVLTLITLARALGVRVVSLIGNDLP
jgi:transcriptional regulator with XRE-family HTH domain